MRSEPWVAPIRFVIILRSSREYLYDFSWNLMLRNFKQTNKQINKQKDTHILRWDKSKGRFVWRPTHACISAHITYLNRPTIHSMRKRTEEVGTSFRLLWKEACFFPHIWRINNTILRRILYINFLLECIKTKKNVVLILIVYSFNTGYSFHVSAI